MREAGHYRADPASSIYRKCPQQHIYREGGVRGRQGLGGGENGGRELTRYGRFLSDGRSVQMLDSVDGDATPYIHLMPLNGTLSSS